MNPLTILIVEDDQLACNSFIEYIDTLDDIDLIGITGDASQALEYIVSCLPHVIILDLELHHGSGSGLDVLRGVKDLPMDVNPYILITTNNSSTVTYEYARQLGADYIMSKHQKDYSEQGVIDFLRLMADAIQTKCKYNRYDLLTTESPHQRNQRIVRRINTELNNVGISPKATGYKYLVDAIILIMEQPQKHMCSTIGKKYGKTESSVERAMQNAINRAWATADIDDLLNHYDAKIHSEKGVPTITEFVCFYANKFKNEY